MLRAFLEHAANAGSAIAQRAAPCARSPHPARTLAGHPLCPRRRHPCPHLQITPDTCPIAARRGPMESAPLPPPPQPVARIGGSFPRTRRPAHRECSWCSPQAGEGRAPPLGRGGRGRGPCPYPNRCRRGALPKDRWRCPGAGGRGRGGTRKTLVPWQCRGGRPCRTVLSRHSRVVLSLTRLRAKTGTALSVAMPAVVVAGTRAEGRSECECTSVPRKGARVRCCRWRLGRGRGSAARPAGRQSAAC